VPSIAYIGGDEDQKNIGGISRIRGQKLNKRVGGCKDFSTKDTRAESTILEIGFLTL